MSASELDALLNTAIERVRQYGPVEAVPLDPALARPKSFLKVLDADHYNWRAHGFRKLFGMRFRVKLPPLDQINLIFYPEADRATPIFIFFCLVTKRKVIAHLNVNCPFDDAGYRAQWVEPLLERLRRYPSFECDDRYPAWMLKYRNDCTIYGMFPKQRFEDLRNCALDYLDCYLPAAAQQAPETDPQRLQCIREFHDGFVSDIRTQDKAQGMIARMIGKETARRIFYEVTT